MSAANVLYRRFIVFGFFAFMSVYRIGQSAPLSLILRRLLLLLMVMMLRQ